MDFRAPPPSPVASGRRSSVANDEELTHFLQTSLRVPDLVLPDRIFPRQNLVSHPPSIDLQSLDSIDGGASLELLESIANVGCFEVVNHGIPRDVIMAAVSGGGGVFGVPPEMKAAAARSPERVWGFEEVHGEEESEEFVWCKDDHVFNLELEGIWPGFSNFREKMERLSRDVLDISGKVFEFMEKNSSMKLIQENDKQLEDDDDELSARNSTICYLHKQKMQKTDGTINSLLKYDVIKILIRGCEFPHAFCVHFTNSSSHFNVYSKKDWLSFQPHHNDSLIFTVGDQLQAWSGGKYKHVIGRAIFQEEKEECISMAILYSPPKTIKNKKENTISFTQQIIFAILFISICQIISSILNKI